MRRAVLRFLWGFDRVAAWMAPRLRAAVRCFYCGRKLTGDELEHYGHVCEWCERINCRAYDEPTNGS